MRILRRSGFLVAVLLLHAVPCLCRTWHILPDGSGDAPTIQAGIDSCSDGDIIELADGTFTGQDNRDLDYRGKAITICSQGGAEVCILDVEGSEEDPHRAVCFQSGETSESVLQGVTIRNGWHTMLPNAGGGGVLCDGADPSFLSCVFTANETSSVLCLGGAHPTFDRCLFRGNHGKTGGAIHFQECDLTINQCSFLENNAWLRGGALHGHSAAARIVEGIFLHNTAGQAAAGDFIYGCDVLFRGCLFAENSPTLYPYGMGCVNLHGMVTGAFEYCTFVGNIGGTIVETSKMSHGYISNCSFVENEATGDGVIFCGESDFVIRNTVVASSIDGRAICVAGQLTIECCDLYENAGGDWVGPLAGQLGVNGNFTADPLFCNRPEYDLTLAANSPCLPGNHPAGWDCGLIGALGQGCGPVALTPQTWTRVKAKYR